MILKLAFFFFATEPLFQVKIYIKCRNRWTDKTKWVQSEMFWLDWEWEGRAKTLLCWPSAFHCLQPWVAATEHSKSENLSHREVVNKLYSEKVQTVNASGFESHITVSISTAKQLWYCNTKTAIDNIYINKHGCVLTKSYLRPTWFPFHVIFHISQNFIFLLPFFQSIKNGKQKQQ